jgi:glycogen phosphorylase
MSQYAALPPLPERIARLGELANDLWWSWHPEGRAVFRHLDYQLWRSTAHNPVRMLWQMTRDKLEAAARNPEFAALYDQAIEALDHARAARNTWWANRFAHLDGPVAYFSAEFALHQSLPIYAGGLGVLAGDHCKEAADLGVPLIGVGFM